MAYRSRERRRRDRGAPPLRLTRRRLLGLGLAGAVVGGGLVSTGAQSTIDAFRSNRINTAADPDALLGLSGIDTTAQMPTFTNQTGSPITVTLSSADDIQFDADDLGNWVDPPVVFDLQPGESQLYNVRGSVSFADVTIDVVIKDGLGATIGAISATRSFAIPAAGNILEVAGTFKSAGKSGKYEYDLQNVGTVDATLVAIGVRGTTNPNAIEVSSGKILTVDNDQVMTSIIPVDSTDLTTDTKVDFDTNVVLAAGQTRTFEFDRFQQLGSPSNADMTEQDVKITIYSSDGGSATTNICFGTCDF